MKKIILYIAALTMTLSSCGNDWLDLRPDNAFEVPDSLTYKDLQAMKVGLYDGIQQGPYNSVDYYSARFIYNGDVRGDDFQYNKLASSRALNSYSFTYSTDDGYGCWQNAYWTIMLANKIIEADLYAVEEEKNKDGIAEIKGEAYFLRALCHFDIMRDYSDFWNLESKYGIPIVEKSVPASDLFSAQPGRKSVKEVYDWVVEELKTNAIPNLSEVRHEIGFVDVYAAKALLARVYLFMGENEKCVDVAEEVIANSAGYKLWSNAEYKEAWTRVNHSEALFEIISTDIDNNGLEGIGYLMERKGDFGYGDVVTTVQYTKLFGANDVRKTLFFDKMHMDKYPGVIKSPASGDWDNKTASLPVLRLSELYLNAAEAGIKAGGAYEAKGNQFLTAIVQRANPDAPAITNANLDRVLFERRLELGGEGWRVSDVLRNNKKMYRDNLNGYMEDINACVPEVNVTITQADIDANAKIHSPLSSTYGMIDRTCSKIVLPLPKAEMEVNKTISTQQFPSWL